MANSSGCNLGLVEVPEAKGQGWKWESLNLVKDCPAKPKLQAWAVKFNRLVVTTYHFLGPYARPGENFVEQGYGALLLRWQIASVMPVLLKKEQHLATLQAEFTSITGKTPLIQPPPPPTPTPGLIDLVGKFFSQAGQVAVSLVPWVVGGLAVYTMGKPLATATSSWISKVPRDQQPKYLQDRVSKED
jgi:hypothetical protein